jgi:ankyrin repeat protein
MRACALGNTDIVQILLSHNPKIGITNKNSQKAFQLICQRVAVADAQKERIRNLLNVSIILLNVSFHIANFFLLLMF